MSQQKIKILPKLIQLVMTTMILTNQYKETGLN